MRIRNKNKMECDFAITPDTSLKILKRDFKYYEFLEPLSEAIKIAKKRNLKGLIVSINEKNAGAFCTNAIANIRAIKMAESSLRNQEKRRNASKDFVRKIMNGVSRDKTFRSISEYCVFHGIYKD